MRCCRYRTLLILQTSLVMFTIYLVLFSGLLDFLLEQESMEVVTTIGIRSNDMEEWDEVVAKIGEKLIVKRSRNKNPRILEYPSY